MASASHSDHFAGNIAADIIGGSVAPRYAGNAMQPRAQNSFRHRSVVYIAAPGVPEPRGRSNIVTRDGTAIWPWHELGQAITLPRYNVSSDEDEFHVDQVARPIVSVQWNHLLIVEALNAKRKLLRGALRCSLAVVMRVDGNTDWVYAPDAHMYGPAQDASGVPMGFITREPDSSVVDIRWVLGAGGKIYREQFQDARW